MRKQKQRRIKRNDIGNARTLNQESQFARDRLKHNSIHLYFIPRPISVQYGSKSEKNRGLLPLWIVCYTLLLKLCVRDMLQLNSSHIESLETSTTREYTNVIVSHIQQITLIVAHFDLSIALHTKPKTRRKTARNSYYKSKFLIRSITRLLSKWTGYID